MLGVVCVFQNFSGSPIACQLFIYMLNIPLQQKIISPLLIHRMYVRHTISESNIYILASF